MLTHNTSFLDTILKVSLNDIYFAADSISGEFQVKQKIHAAINALRTCSEDDRLNWLTDSPMIRICTVTMKNEGQGWGYLTLDRDALFMFRMLLPSGTIIPTIYSTDDEETGDITKKLEKGKATVVHRA